jgi:N-acyl-D-amino-acid deacylase
LPNDIWDDGPGGVSAKLTSPAVRRRFAILLETTSRNAVDRIRIAWVQSKANAIYQGKTLAEYIAAAGKPPADALCDLLLEENLAVLGVFHVGDDLLVEPVLKHPKYMLGSDGTYQPDGPVHPRQFGSTARILGPLVRDRNWFTLEEAVKKMTSIPAARFGLTDRGVVRNGAFADLTVFDAATIADCGRFGDSRHAPVGIDHVLVNGTPIVENGNPLSQLGTWPGRWLKYGK